MGQNFSSLQYGHCRDITHAPMPMQCFIHVKVNFEQKSGSSHCEISVSCTGQKYDNFTTPYPFFCSIICQVVTYGRLKTKENCNLLGLKAVAVAYKRWSLTRGSKYSDLTGNFWYFGKLVAKERWSLTRVGRNRRFDCS